MRESIQKNNQGIAALLGVVIIAAVALLLASNLSVIGRADLGIVNNNIHASVAMSNAESCLEEALRQIQLDENYISSAISLNLEKGSCLAKVSKIGANYTVYSEGRIFSYLKIIEAEVSRTDDSVTINIWGNR